MTEPTATAPQKRFRDFFLVWLGQVVSVFGSGLTAFAVGVWVYQRTGSATMFTAIAVFGSLPGLLLSPFVGVLVDRWDRRKLLILADLVAALGTVALATLYIAGLLQVWHIYVIVAVGAAAMSLQIPAYFSSVTMLIPKEQFGRAHGLLQFGESTAQILAPLTAGALIAVLTLSGIVLVDLATFLFAVVVLLMVRIPRPPASAAGRAAQGSILRQAAYGWQYITARPGLTFLVGFFAMVNLLLGLAIVLVTPLVLSIASPRELGMVLAAGSVGGLLGSIAMTAWGGPKPRIHGILGFAPMLGLGLLLIGLSPAVPLIATGYFLFFFAVPIIGGSNQAIWQRKVEPDVQGRVFATRRLITQITAPIAYALAGPLADRFFGPLLAPQGALADSVGRWLGTGPGRGIGLMFVVMGGLLVVAAACGYLFPRLRRLEDELPDALPPAAAPARA